MDDLLLPKHFIIALGGTYNDPENYSEDLEGFQNYLSDTGVQYFNAKEFLIPHKPDVAKELDLPSIFLPERSKWALGAVLGLIADRLRKEVKSPVRLRNWWRPEEYNKAVGGSKRSDHVGAYALDLDFKNAELKNKASKLVEMIAKVLPDLKISMGIYRGVSLHIGVLSPLGARRW